MKFKTARDTLRTGFLIAPLVLVACTGGGNDVTSVCNDPSQAVCGSVGSAPVPTETTAAPNTPDALASTSPGSLTLKAGSSATYSVSGGVPPYTATSGNTNVATVNITGSTMIVNSIDAGTSPLAIVDAAGKAIAINVTTLAQGQSGTPLTIAPESITTANCATNLPFFIRGGVAPYFSFVDDGNVRISSAQASYGRPYFTASVEYDGNTAPLAPIVLTVTDNQFREATAKIAVPTHESCIVNSLLEVDPKTSNIRVTEVLRLHIVGGAAQTKNFTFTDNDSTVRTTTSSVVEVVGVTNGDFHVRGLATGITMVTVNDPVDKQNANVTIAVF